MTELAPFCDPEQLRSPPVPRGVPNDAALADLRTAVLAPPLDLDGTHPDALDRIEAEAATRPWIILRATDCPPEAIQNRHKQIADALGTPLRIPAQSAGTVVHVRPQPRFNGEVVPSYRNTLRFDYHSELTYLAVPPTWVMLTAVHNDMGCATLVSSAGALLRLSSDTFAQLVRPVYRFLFPPYWRTTTAPRLSRPRPAVSFDDGLRLRCRFDDVVAADAAAEAATKQLHAAFAAHTQRIALAPGETLVINNRRCVHGRDAIVPTGSRLLLKSYVWGTADLASVAAAGFLRAGQYAEFDHRG